MKQVISFILLFCLASSLHAKYAPPPFFDMVGASDLIVLGEITEVKEKTFVLNIQKILVGEYKEATVEIAQFKDWTCSSRWAPYEKGQQVIAFVRSSKNKAGFIENKLRSAGSEGEFPVDGKFVYYQGYGIKDIPYVNEGNLSGQKFSLNEMCDAIEGYSSCFKLGINRKEYGKIVSIIQVGSAEVLNAYSEKSVLHKNLISATQKYGKDHKIEIAMELKSEASTSVEDEGYTVRPSGLKYKIVREGTGKSPGLGNEVLVHYEGKFLDGRVFDSSYQKGKPITFRVSKVIAGWIEALQLMKVGAHWKLIIPADLAYGKLGAANIIPPNTTLAFDVELLDIIASEKKSKRKGYTRLPSGLEYKIIRPGTGEKPGQMDRVMVHYEGKFLDGRVFDSSYQRGKPITFKVRGVIAGWTEALQLMKVGAHWRLYIPSKLAYGRKGMGNAIPPNTPLAFDVELLEIVKE